MPHTGACWLPWSLRGLMPRRSAWRVAQFDTLRRHLVKLATRVVALEAENARLKKLLADAMLDNAVLKDVASKKWWRPTRGERPRHACVRSTRRASAGRAG